MRSRSPHHSRTPRPETAVREALENVDLEDLVIRLLGFANSQIRRRVWRGVQGGLVPGGVLAEDVVQTAFQKLLSGARKFPNDIDLFTCLAGIVASDISHLSTAVENAAPHEYLDAPVDDGSVVELAASTGSHEDRLIASEHIEQLANDMRADIKLRKYLRLLALRACANATEYAEQVGVSRDTVFNMNRRIMRHTNRRRG